MAPVAQLYVGGSIVSAPPVVPLAGGAVVVVAGGVVVVVTGGVVVVVTGGVVVVVTGGVVAGGVPVPGHTSVRRGLNVNSWVVSTGLTEIVSTLLDL